MPDIKEGKFEIFWSQEDQEWVARHTVRHPSASGLSDNSPVSALEVLLEVIFD